jgi:dihydrofolate reductase
MMARATPRAKGVGATLPFVAARTVYYAAMSLDGYIAEPEEKLDWLTGFEGAGSAVGEGNPIADSYPSFIAGVGSLAMGSKTYEFLLRGDYWDYGDMPAWVYTSRDLDRLGKATDLRFVSGGVADHHAEQLEAAGGKNLWVMGGGDLASQYAAAGLLDLVRVTVVPIALGAGLPLFAEPLPKPMRLLGVTPFSNGMVELSYEVAR